MESARQWLMIRTDTLLEEQLSLSVCAPCNVVSLSTTSVNLNTHALTVIATLIQDS